MTRSKPLIAALRAAALGFALGAASLPTALAAPLTYDEGVGGDIHNASFTLDVGTNVIAGTSGVSDGDIDQDFFDFIVPAGTQLVGLSLSATRLDGSQRLQVGWGLLTEIPVDLLLLDPASVLGVIQGLPDIASQSMAAAFPFGAGSYAMLNGFAPAEDVDLDSELLTSTNACNTAARAGPGVESRHTRPTCPVSCTSFKGSATSRPCARESAATAPDCTPMASDLCSKARLAVSEVEVSITDGGGTPAAAKLASSAPCKGVPTGGISHG
jgi:hypothetical protein